MFLAITIVRLTLAVAWRAVAASRGEVETISLACNMGCIRSSTGAGVVTTIGVHNHLDVGDSHLV